MKQFKSKRQEYIYKKLMETDPIKANSYIQSKNGRMRHINKDNVLPISRGKDYLSKLPNHIVYFNKFQYDVDDDTNHKPPTMNKDDWFGVEIECFIPYSSLGMDDYDNKVTCSTCDGDGYIYENNEDNEEVKVDCSDCDGRGHWYDDDDSESAGDHEDTGRRRLKELFVRNKIKLTSVKYDGSLSVKDGHEHEYFTVEVVVLSRFSNTDNLKQVCDLLNKLNAEVNASCGLHIHYDMRGRTEQEVQLIGDKLEKCLPIMYKLVPKSRRSNSYCEQRVSSFNENDSDGRERYAAINLTAFRKHGTLECRLHSGTTNFNKIINWATLVRSIIKTKKIGKICKTLNDLTQYVDVSQELLEYFTQREILFSDKDVQLKLEVPDIIHDSDNVESEVA